MYRRLFLSAMMAAVMGLAAGARPAAAFDEINKTFFGGVAIDGYDPSAYHTAGKPTKGSSDHVVNWKGAKWKFATKADADKFRADPARYAPAYGGHCANAMSMGDRVDADPKVWMIIGKRLFLFYADSGRKTWQSGDKQALIAKADANWAKMLKGK